MPNYIDFDLNPDGSITPRHPDARPGAGRKPGFSPKKAKRMENEDLFGDEDDGPNETTSLVVRKARAVAAKEEWLAKNQELKYKVDSGEYLSRSAFREASATLLAEVAHAIRSLPDLLERKAALQADQLELVEKTIDAALNSLADGLELFVEQPAGAVHE